jgi:uncharacterized protein (DUF433 family)
MARFQAHERIERNPAVMIGKAVIKGTRIPVDLIRREISGGRSFAEIIESYPRLTEDDLRAALSYVGDVKAPEGLDLGSEDDAIREGLADLDAGRAISHRDMSEWLATWGSPDPTPAPSAWSK